MSDKFTWKDNAIRVGDDITWRPPGYECPVHGDIGDETVSFKLPYEDLNEVFCLRCCLSKMVEVDVCKATLKKGEAND